MQYVGTLSWGMAAAPAVRRTFGRAKLQETAMAAAARRDGTRCAAISMGAATLEAAPAKHAGRTEVRALEQDWTQIVRRSMNGDSGAWAEMVRSHQKRVYGLCYRFTGNAADAEDLTQDVFLKIYMNLGSFDATRGSLPVWITTMTRNLLVDNFRRTRNLRATGSLDEGWDQTEELRPIDRLADAGPSPHESAARNELKKMVQKALLKVSVELREAVILRDLQDLDYKEIAQVLGIPEGTVKSRISRGRAELARFLERSKREVM
ncbi:MAG: sigma-70 family RNA polymerase sigma factor [Terracidiphilus sp.]|jgi:RNA polymerase sigma-70 factor (ECF subfamily)